VIAALTTRGYHFGWLVQLYVAFNKETLDVLTVTIVEFTPPYTAIAAAIITIIIMIIMITMSRL